MAKQYRDKKRQSTRGEQPYPDLIFPDPSDPDSILFRDNRYPDKIYHYSSYLHGETSEWVEGEDLKVPESVPEPEEDWRVKMRKGYEQEAERRKKKMEEVESFMAERERIENIMKEKLENEKLERERREEDKLQQKRLEQERLEKQHLENQRLELEKLKLEQKRLEEERLAQGKIEQEKLERERMELERVKLQLEQQKLEQQRLEQERIEKERLRQEKLDKERERLKKQKLEEKMVMETRLKQERHEQERHEQERLQQDKLERQRLEHEKMRQERFAQLELENQRLKKQRLEKEIREQSSRDQETAQTIIQDQVTSTWETSGAAPPARNAWLEKAKAMASGLLDGINPITNLALPNATDDEVLTTTPLESKPALDSPTSQKDQTLISDLTSSSSSSSSFPFPLLAQPVDELPNPLDDLPTSASSALAAKSAAREIGFAPKEPHFRVPYARSTCEETLYTTHHATTTTTLLLGPSSPHLLTPELSICWFLLFLFLFPRVLIPFPLRQAILRKVTISPHNQKSWRYLRNFLRGVVAVWMVHIGWTLFLDWLTEEETVIWWDDDAPRVWYCGCESWPVFKPLEVLGWCERRA